MRRSVSLALFALLGMGARAEREAPQSATAPDIEQTFQEIVTRHEAGEAGEVAYELHEKGVNVYLREQRAADFPKAVKSPWVRFEDEVAVVGATVNLDELKAEMPPSSILHFLSGFVPVELTARLQTGGGIGKIILERVSFAGIELPPDFIENLAKRHGTTMILPDGFRIGEPFPLPYGLESIRSVPGAMLVKQIIKEPKPTRSK